MHDHEPDAPAVHDREALEHALAAAARSFFHPRSVEETFTAVTESVTELIDAADCADILVVAGATAFQSHAATSELPLRLDSLQERLGEGPCVDAARTEVLVASDDLATDPRWPRFGPAAVEAGVRSALSFQLYTNEDTVGALNVFALTPNAFGPRDIEIGEILATHAAVAVYAANKNKQFESALASRDLIGQAKGMLMERYRIDAAQAFALMSKLSQDSNVPLAALAADIVRLGSESSGSR